MLASGLDEAQGSSLLELPHSSFTQGQAPGLHPWTHNGTFDAMPLPVGPAGCFMGWVGLESTHHMEGPLSPQVCSSWIPTEHPW